MTCTCTEFRLFIGGVDVTTYVSGTIIWTKENDEQEK